MTRPRPGYPSAPQTTAGFAGQTAAATNMRYEQVQGGCGQPARQVAPAVVDQRGTEYLEKDQQQDRDRQQRLPPKTGVPT